MQTANSLTHNGCPRCTSPAPHLHPAMQHGGEVQPCLHPFHEQVTPENTPEKIAQARRWRDDWSFSASSVDGSGDPRIDMWPTDDGEVALSIQHLGAENGLRLRRDAAKRLWRSLGRMLGESVSAEPEESDRAP